MELLTSFLVIVILATTSAKPTGRSRHHDADIADNDLSTLLELHRAMRSSESWRSSQSSESWQSSHSSESETSESNSSSQQDSSDSSESNEDSEEDDSDSSEESSEEVIIVIPVPTTTTPGLESPSTAVTPTVDAGTTATRPTPAPEGMSTGGQTTALPLTTHDVTLVTLPGTDLTPCVTHDIVTPTQDTVTPAPVTETRGDN